MRRRALLRTTGVALTAGLAGCGADGDGTSTDGGTPTTVESDETGPATATPTDTRTATATAVPTAARRADRVVAVGPDDSLSFDPASFEIRGGETVAWVWESSAHNLVVDSMPDDAAWEGTPGDDRTTYDAGYTHTHTFTVPGEYGYRCAPHGPVGMQGSFTVVDPGTPTPTLPGSATYTPSPTPLGDQVVDVGPDPAEPAFEPDEFEVATGETVVWVWESDGHNVVVDSAPDDAQWEGTPGDETALYDEGYTHSHAFTVPGEYEYYCLPHRGLGMVGSFTVTE